MSLLEGMSPERLKGMSLEELHVLAREIRETILRAVSSNGGHLAPNLGVVELTIALHRVFDSPRDKIIWDVGHQCYAHKLITGRYDRFETLRRFGGLSGFPKREESPHDVFNTGHSSTSISAALGYALARDLQGDDFKVVAVIGDGALTGGMAYEALNHAGHAACDLIVILNDNEKSINDNVGAMARYLSRLRTDPAYFRHKHELESWLKGLPVVGKRVADWAERIKDSLKYLVVPGMLFEELGFTYLGPIPGHNLEVLIEVLSRARGMKGPVLIHVLTKKGKGYKPAEKNPDLFHGISEFDLETGEIFSGNGPPTFTEVFGETLMDLAERDARIVAITAAMADGTGLGGFAARFPRRFIDVGIAEQHAVTLAAGLAAQGLRPVVAIYSTFLQRAYDQIIHDVALQGLPVIFCLDRAGLVGEDGETHHGVFDLSYLRTIPGLTIMVPRNENMLRSMLYTAVNLEGPVAIRYPRGRGIGVPREEPVAIPVGRGEELRKGRDATVLAVGPVVYKALEAAESLAQFGFSVGVVDARFVHPLDEELIVELARETNCILTVEENIGAGGFGGAVGELLHREGIASRLSCLALPSEFIPHGKAEELRERYGLSAAAIAGRLRELLEGRGERSGVRVYR